MPHYFVPMLVEEFNNLLRLGALRLPQGRWIYSKPAEASGSPETTFFAMLQAITPTFEDTISIVIVEFARCASGMAGQHILAEFFFIDAVATYALTHHDREVLNTRLSPAAKLVTCLLIDESAIQSWKQGLFATRSRQGAQALLIIYQGKNNLLVSDNLLAQDELLKALDLRQQYRDSPISEGSYLDNLICYSRSGPISNNDAGFFYDAICILEYYLDKKSGRKKADYYEVGNFSFIPMVNDLIDTGDSRKFDGYVKLPGALVSSLVFLKLNHEIRKHNQSLNREWLRDCLGPIHDQASVARGVWWCGGFWGFTQFAEDYYAVASLPETPEPRFPDSPPPVPTASEFDAPAPGSTPRELATVPATECADSTTAETKLAPAPVESIQELTAVESVQESIPVVNEPMESAPPRIEGVESASVPPSDEVSTEIHQQPVNESVVLPPVDDTAATVVDIGSNQSEWVAEPGVVPIPESPEPVTAELSFPLVDNAVASVAKPPPKARVVRKAKKHD